MATTTHDESTFTLRKREWHGTYPLEDLPKWLAFYRKMKREFPKSGSAYDETIAALEKLEAELAAMR
ncbi:hypothetical protein [Paracoccus siganidrum]|uniref:Uncharacterized protein n=1 Tax=Paracoccus siganidrum TaxID=1276757 RepID=A0A419A696_9RHOB|nr:hypothetical protein [Paracoccus siganidrum]RJL13681.1 hypothetical protein D3P05_11780 [Paracoccus siganidrum]RMC33440.1 hypothetical protein C9E82_13400 [Paracoccus siganidrum]